MHFNKLKFSILAFLLAFAGINYEFLISQGISANFGGTFVQYMLVFALFTFSLGLGAFWFQNLTPEKFDLKKLGYLQIALSAVALLLPHYFQWTDPWIHPESTRSMWIGLSYLPAILFGLVTGLEIPFLMSVAKDQAITVLAFDFLGMFVGTILFPTVMLFTLGLARSTEICAGLNLLIGFYLIFFVIQRSPRQQQILAVDREAGTGMGPASRQKWFYVAVAFILAFCSFSYEAMVTKFVISIVGDEFQSQVYMIGFFLLGLGLGGLWVDLRPAKNALSQLIKVEFILASFVACLPVVLLLLTCYLELVHRNFVNSKFTFIGLPVLPLCLGLFPLIVGTLTGMELPLIFRRLQMNGSEKFSIRLVAVNYFGSLCAGLVTTLMLLPWLGSLKLFTVVSLLNVLALYILVLDDDSKQRTLKMLIPFGALAFCYFGLQFQDPLQKAFLKIHYEELQTKDVDFKSLHNLNLVLDEIGSIFRIESKYQNIDLVLAQETRLMGENHSFALYLNYHPQFSAGNWKTYHESLSYGAFNLAKKIPEKVLILGAGDGLLAHELLQFSEIKKITLVELDPEMVELANHFSSITDLNKNALQDPRVEVLIKDAYQYAKVTALSSSEKYDAIFIDFPFPNSFDLLRLYSVEFYKNIFAILRPDGFAILDAPLSHRLDIHDPADDRRYAILQTTLAAAGFVKPFAFGPFDPFLFVTKDNRDIHFAYDVLPKTITNRGYVNLLKIPLLEGLTTNSPDANSMINSIYFPKWLN